MLRAATQRPTRLITATCTLAFALALVAGCAPQTPPDSLSSPGAPVDRAAPSAPDSAATGERDGSAERPLRLILMPTEGGAADKVIAGVQPVLTALTKDTGLNFEAKVADSYAGTVEGMATRHADIAQMGPFAYLKARERGVAELLAVAVRKGESTYYGGIFCRKDTGIKTLQDLKGKSVAFGDVNSMSSFNYPCALLLQSGVDPTRDLGAVYLTNSHANVVAALAAGKVDAGCCTIGSFEAAAREGRLDPEKFVLVAKSDAIPGSPLVMSPKLPTELKERLRKGFAGLAHSPSLPDGLVGSDGKPLDKYDTTITDADYDAIAKYVRPITDDFKAAMLSKAGKRP